MVRRTFEAVRFGLHNRIGKGEQTEKPRNDPPITILTVPKPKMLFLTLYEFSYHLFLEKRHRSLIDA
ncbi:MAG: hypothetical protein ACFFC7_04940 [Candidatus Hermodarchaeota archaeon]